ncbi:MAG: EAL domain-containing protein [Pseudomonadaceae bacterium]|nr:EAL domain-containing protein [Pseudomonadaceae bacterium]
MIGQWFAGLEYVLPYATMLGGAGMAVAGVWWRTRSQMKAVLAHEVDVRTRQMAAVSRRYKLMVDNAYDLTAIVNEDGTLDYVNAAYSRVLGYNREEVRGQELAALVHPADMAAVQAVVRDVLGGKPLGALAFRFRPREMHAAQGWVQVEAVVKGLPDADWQVRQVVLHAHDVTAYRTAQDELERSELRFRDFAASSADWLWEVDVAGVFTYVSPGVAGVLGYAPEDLMGTGQLSALFEGGEANPTQDLIVSRMDRRQPYRDLEFWAQAKDGERVCLRLSGVPVFDEDGHFEGYRGAASNITASKLDRENMYRMATSDQLTGLVNRTRFKEELERAVNLSRRHETSGVLIFIDLDRFKEVNDTHGHEAGDRILQGVADILRQQMRSTDVVARLGGDEFGIIMHNIPVDKAEAKVHKIVEKVKAMALDYNGAKLGTTMSMGMVQYPQDEKGVDHLIMSADLAMYRAKDMGRNRLFVERADETADTVGSVKAQLKWVDRLKECMTDGDFEMHYQAIVPDRVRERPLFEALLRIYDKDGKVVSPALYIDAAEHFGLIQQLDLAVTRRVFETQKKLMKQGIEADISINLSCRSLGDAAVMAKVKELLHETQIDPRRIVFEVTETMALHDPAEMRDIEEIGAFITELRGLGFRFALDDFGSGFTSFKYLRVLDVDIVKIDGAFVKDMVANSQDQLFVKHMAALCKGMGIMTIAEFVEDEPTRDVLRSLGIDYGQGWLFAKPQPDIEALCAAYAGRVMMDYPLKEAPKTVEKAAKGKAKGKGNVVRLKTAKGKKMLDVSK